ncbi:hypothetical protein BDF22DRAFT_651904 [Syncephalis plumigaleata]|nr:hypothetical protein BDF22DRAFT_651904 [Syncephalis plumigaleata]
MQANDQSLKSGSCVLHNSNTQQVPRKNEHHHRLSTYILIELSTIIDAILSRKRQQEGKSNIMLLLLLNKLPKNDFRRFILNLDGLDVVRLSCCCRLLKRRLQSDVLLWRQIYHHHFLTGLNVAKEFNFLYWCARNSLARIDPSVKLADLLTSIDWYATYRRRICTESNWRRGRARCTTIPLPLCTERQNWVIINQCATAILLKHSLSNGGDGNGNGNHHGNPSLMAGLESTPYSTGIVQPVDVRNGPSTISTEPILVQLGSASKGLTIPFVTTLMSDLFTLTISHRPRVRKKIKVWYRQTYEFKLSRLFSLGHRLEVVNGKWAVLLNRVYTPDGIGYDQIIVWDIEEDVQHVEDSKHIWDSACILQSSNSAVMVYAVSKDTEHPELITWTLYRFSMQEPPRQLTKKCFTTELDFRGYIMSSPLDASRVLLEDNDTLGDRRLLIHSVWSDTPSNLELDAVEIPEEHVTTALLSQGSKANTNDRLLVERHQQFTYNANIRWANAIECQHIIGDLCIIYEKQKDDSILIALVDNRTGEFLRYIDKYSSAYFNAFLMTSAITIDNDKGELYIANYVFGTWDIDR